MVDAEWIEYSIPVLLVTLIAFLLYVYGTWTYSTWSNVGVRGPKPLPFIGNALDLARQGFYDKYMQWRETYGKTYGIYFARWPVLITSDMDIIKEVFIRDFTNFSTRGCIDNSPFIPHPLDKSVFSSNGQQWRRQRTTMSPTFTASKMKGMGYFVTRCCQNLSGFVGKKADTKQPMDVKQIFGAYTLDIIAGTSLGFETNGLKEVDDNNVFLESLKGFFKDLTTIKPMAAFAFCFPYLVPVLKVFGYNISSRKETNFIIKTMKEVVAEGRKSMRQGKPDLIQMLLDAESTKEEIAKNPEAKKMTEEEIIGQAMIAFVAGYETTATTLQFLSYLLATNPEKQEKLYQEIVDKIGNDDPCYDNVSRVPYLENCIRETLRMYPPVVTVSREALQERTIKGVTISAGTSVAASIYCIAQDSELFPEPQKFIPERYEDESMPSTLRDIVFGCGPRQCIGMRLALYEAKMAIVTLLRQYKFVKVPQTTEKVILSPKNIIATPTVRLIVGAERREQMSREQVPFTSQRN